jgi:hypothetical protein
MKEIALTRGFVAIVDDEDYEWLSATKWHFVARWLLIQQHSPSRDRGQVDNSSYASRHHADEARR